MPRADQRSPPQKAFDFTGGYGGPSWAFTPYRKPEVVWAQFLAWWAAKWPGRPIPVLHNLRALTGLSDERIREYLAKPPPAPL